MKIMEAIEFIAKVKNRKNIEIPAEYIGYIPKEVRVIIFIEKDKKIKTKKIYRKPGAWEGQVVMTEDFDELPEEFMAYFKEDPKKDE